MLVLLVLVLLVLLLLVVVELLVQVSSGRVGVTHAGGGRFRSRGGRAGGRGGETHLLELMVLGHDVCLKGSVEVFVVIERFEHLCELSQRGAFDGGPVLTVGQGVLIIRLLVLLLVLVLLLLLLVVLLVLVLACHRRVADPMGARRLAAPRRERRQRGRGERSVASLHRSRRPRGAHRRTRT